VIAMSHESEALLRCLVDLAGAPDIRHAIRWPGFREQAMRIGLWASLSIPLFAGSGAPIADLR
jgi:hypothetical protein